MSSDSLDAAIRAAAVILADAGIDSAATDAVTLAAHALGVSRAEVARLRLLGAVAPEGYADLVAERATRVPLQHLTGLAGFRHLDLHVGPGVFVPRPETEMVAGLAISAALPLAAPVVVDLCTGSGAIALSVKDEVPAAQVYAVELSPHAFAWAQRNRDTTELEVTLVLGDATEALPALDGRVDVVVSNPPYIPVGMVPVDPEVRDHDPAVALYGGSESGLAIPLAVAARAAELLRPGGVLVMEHADSQGSSLPAALIAAVDPDGIPVWREVTDHVDLAGRPRATRAIRV